MKIKVQDDSGRVYDLNVDPTDNMFQLKAKVSSQMGGGISVHALKVAFNGKDLEDFSNFIQNQVKEGDTMQVKGGRPAQQPAQNIGGQRPANNNHSNFQAQALGEAQQLRKHYETNTSELNMLLEGDPELAQAILSDDVQDTVNMVVARVDWQS